MPLDAGATLGHYRIVALLGAGGMGEVYRARDTRLARDVAVKVIRADFASPERRARFFQEAQAASALNHPNIVTIYDIGSQDGVDFLAMEYIAGKRLDEQIRGGALEWRDALRLAIPIADALAAAHAAAIVHRDLKPANVMISSDGRVKLLDFGLAKLLAPAADEETATLRLETQHGMLMGTTSYMSPEQAEGKAVDGRSDIFSFGAVLYEMLTRRRAFVGESMVSILSSVLRDQPAPLAEIAPDAPRAIGRIVARCLHKDPGQRYQSMADVRIVLEDALETAGGLPAVPAAGKPKRTLLSWALASAFFIAVSGLGWLAIRSGPAVRLEYKLRQLTFDSGLTSYPAMSADGKLLAYASDRAADSGLDIWVQQLNGGAAIRLTHDPGDEKEVAIAPDGSAVVYRSEQDGGLYSIPTLGGEPRRIAARGHDPKFSPDGSHVAYSTDSASTDWVVYARASELWIMTAQGENARRLCEDFDVVLSPVWAADSGHLLFLGLHRRGEKNPPRWYITDTTTGGTAVPVDLNPPGEGRFTPAAWDPPRGRYLLWGGRVGNLWLLELSPRTWTIKIRERLTSTSQQQAFPTADSAGQIVFSEVRETRDVWELDLAARPGAGLRRVTSDLSAKSVPKVSADGRWLAYVSSRTGSPGVWLLDLHKGLQKPLTQTARDENNPTFTAGDTKIAYSANEGAGKRSHYLSPIGGGVPEKICDDCARLDQVTEDLRYIVRHRGGTGITLHERATGKYLDVLADPPRSLFQPRISEDSRWISFLVKTTDLDSRLYVAPFRGFESIPKSSWIALSSGHGDDKPLLAPANRGIYFTSLRDGYRCIYYQTLDAGMHPVGDPVSIRHLHETRFSLGAVNNPELELSLARNKLYFNVSEQSGNLWMMEPENPAEKKR